MCWLPALRASQFLGSSATSPGLQGLGKGKNSGDGRSCPSRPLLSSSVPLKWIFHSVSAVQKPSSHPPARLLTLQPAGLCFHWLLSAPVELDIAPSTRASDGSSQPSKQTPRLTKRPRRPDLPHCFLARLLRWLQTSPTLGRRHMRNR